MFRESGVIDWTNESGAYTVEQKINVPNERVNEINLQHLKGR